MKYKTRPGIILTSVGDQYYLVFPKSRIELNETAAFYWRQLIQGADADALRAAAVREYDIDDSEELEQEIAALIAELLKGRLIKKITESDGMG